MATEAKDQQHPQYKGDRQIVSQILNGEPTDYNLVELARLIVRYKGFPGARDIQIDLEKTLRQWQLTEASLYERTRDIHQKGDVYSNMGRNRDDWS